MPDSKPGKNPKQESTGVVPTKQRLPDPKASPKHPNPPAGQNVPSNGVGHTIQDVEDRVKRAEWWMIRLTGGIVVLTFGLVIAAFLQWRVMSGQLGEMKESSRIAQSELTRSHRPWLGAIGGIKVTQPLKFDSRGASVEVEYTVKNVGNSVARSVDISQGLFLTTRTDDNLQSCAASSPTSGTLVIPGDMYTIHETIRSAGMNQKVMDILPDGKTGATLFVCITYTDEFDIHHATPGIWAYWVENGRTFDPNGKVIGVFRPMGTGGQAY